MCRAVTTKPKSPLLGSRPSSGHLPVADHEFVAPFLPTSHVLNITPSVALRPQTGQHAFVKRVLPRPLDANEIAILRQVASALGPPVAALLAAQIGQARVSGGIPTSLDIEVAHPVRVDLADGPLPVDAFVAGGEVLVWITNGCISGLEYAWTSEAVPTGMPPVDELHFVP